MRQILLNDKYYKITGDIIKRAISPWKATIRTTGGLEYQSFQNAELEEWHDLRNGIGLESELPAESARLWWSEGIDFTSPRSAVLGPYVDTAGTFGVAPVKIIDFGGKTYAIGNSKISEWSGSAWTPRDTSLANPLDAIVITDDTDEYLIVSSASDAIYTTDGTTWAYADWVANTAYSVGDFVMPTSINGFCYECTTAGTSHVNTEPAWGIIVDGATSDGTVTWACRTLLARWVSPTGYGDSDDAWDTEASAYDDNTGTYAESAVSSNTWGSYLVLTGDERGVKDFRFWAFHHASHIDQIDLDAYYDSAWHDVYEGAFTTGAWVVKSMTDAHLVSKVRVKFHQANGGSTSAKLYEFDFSVNVCGYLADYQNRLYTISTDGKLVTYSTAKNIDAYGGGFTLTGKFGTVYDLFEGKLLADGTPTLYFCGTEGLFTINTTTHIAYKQEVSYPPLTYAGHKGMYWNANVWVAAGYGILKVAPSMATFVGPDQDDGLPSGYQGKIYDMVTVNNWLVFCVNCGAAGYSSILKRNSSLGGNLQVYTGAENAAIPCLCHTPSSDTYPEGRLWFGEGTSVKYMMFPDTTSNVKQVATYEYVDASGYGKLPILRKLAAISKTALGVAAITKSCTEVSTHDETIEVYYGLNGAAPTTHLGDFTTSPRPTILTFPPPVGEASSTALGTEFYTIQFAFKLTRGTTNTWSPELESLMFYYLPTPTVINGWLFHILATEDDADAIITAFEAIRDTNTLVVFYPSGDPNKTSYNVKLTTMPLRFYHEEQGGREGYIEIDCQEVFKG